MKSSVVPTSSRSNPGLERVKGLEVSHTLPAMRLSCWATTSVACGLVLASAAACRPRVQPTEPRSAELAPPPPPPPPPTVEVGDAPVPDPAPGMTPVRVDETGPSGESEPKSERESDEVYRNAPKRPIGAVMRNAIYAPQPNPKLLDSTKTAQTTRRPGSTKARFCVAKNGKTTAIRTAKKFHGDPEIDRICRDTVETWRFRPFMVADEVTPMCSTVTFDIAFD